MIRKAYTEAVKRNLSSTQVLKTLLKLLQGDYDMNNLIQKLNEEEDEPVFNNSVISKYINTCRYCGIEIHKIHNKYIISKMPFGMNISDREYELLQNLREIANSTMSALFNKNFDNVLTKIGKYSNKQIIKIEEENLNFIEESFRKASEEQRKIRLMFKKNFDMDCCPISIIEKNNKKYFNVLYENKEKSIAIERLSNIEILKTKFKFTEQKEEIIFKLTDNLAVRYATRPDEIIINNHLPEYVVISGKVENMEEELARLMRYDSLCEVLSSTSAREKMKNMINDGE
ncbi:MAG: WYL domain-containing protein [bacterium]|nr:WYL domain-containing protein [bacterium]